MIKIVTKELEFNKKLIKKNVILKKYEDNFKR